MAVPKYDELYNPLLRALRDLGGSGSISEMEERVAEILKLKDADLNRMHAGKTTELGYRLAWARNYLKRYGLLENSSRAVWSLTAKGQHIHKVKREDVNRYVASMRKNESHPDEIQSEKGEQLWQEKLIGKLLKLTSQSFERLCQRLLRESGFVQVEVTGRSGDGGIDGRGIIKVGGLLSFPIIFQCKRYQGSVSSKEIRDFRGAMTGRAEKGLFLTTGAFTRDAKNEAIRDGAPRVDLIDGQELVEKLKELRLGVKVETEEVIEVDVEWLERF